ncbi:MAG TPA: hypothetical protein VEF04_06240 [Blastocatellia bacterium]|nr:hypothetical protein [Blastocatellia bacterium]
MMSRINNRIAQLEAQEAEERSRLDAEIDETFKALTDEQLNELAGVELTNLSDVELEQLIQTEGNRETLADRRASLAQLKAFAGLQ